MVLQGCSLSFPCRLGLQMYITSTIYTILAICGSRGAPHPILRDRSFKCTSETPISNYKIGSTPEAPFSFIYRGSYLHLEPLSLRIG